MDKVKSYNNHFTETSAGAIAKGIFVKPTSSGIDVCGAAGIAVGVTTDTVNAASEPVNVQCGGIAIVCTGAAVTIGNRLESTAAGKATPYSAGYIIGIALDAAAGADEYIRVKLL